MRGPGPALTGGVLTAVNFFTIWNVWLVFGLRPREFWLVFFPVSCCALHTPRSVDHLHHHLRRAVCAVPVHAIGVRRPAVSATASCGCCLPARPMLLAVAMVSTAFIDICVWAVMQPVASYGCSESLETWWCAAVGRAATEGSLKATSQPSSI